MLAADTPVLEVVLDVDAAPLSPTSDGAALTPLDSPRRPRSGQQTATPPQPPRELEAALNATDSGRHVRRDGARSSAGANRTAPAGVDGGVDADSGSPTRKLQFSPRPTARATRRGLKGGAQRVLAARGGSGLKARRGGTPNASPVQAATPPAVAVAGKVTNAGSASRAKHSGAKGPNRGALRRKAPGASPLAVWTASGSGAKVKLAKGGAVAVDDDRAGRKNGSPAVMLGGAWAAQAAVREQLETEIVRLREQIGQQQDDMGDLRDQLKHTTNSLDAQTALVAELSSKLQCSRMTEQQAVLASEAARSRQRELQAQMHAADAESRRVDQVNTTLKQRLDEASARLHSSEEQLALTSTELDNSSATVSELRRDLAHKKLECRALKSSNDLLSKVKAQKESQVIILVNERDKLARHLAQERIRTRPSGLPTHTPSSGRSGASPATHAVLSTPPRGSTEKFLLPGNSGGAGASEAPSIGPWMTFEELLDRAASQSEHEESRLSTSLVAAPTMHGDALPDPVLVRAVDTAIEEVATGGECHFVMSSGTGGASEAKQAVVSSPWDTPTEAGTAGSQLLLASPLPRTVKELLVRRAAQFKAQLNGEVQRSKGLEDKLRQLELEKDDFKRRFREAAKARERADKRASKATVVAKRQLREAKAKRRADLATAKAAALAGRTLPVVQPPVNESSAAAELAEM